METVAGFAIHPPTVVDIAVFHLTDLNSMLSGSTRVNLLRSPLFSVGASISKIPKLFLCISGDKFSLYLQSHGVSRHETYNILIIIPFTTYEKTSFTESGSEFKK